MENRPLTDTEKDEIAELAATKAYDRFYLAVGKSIIKRLLWVIGAGCFATFVFLTEGIPK
tara:strand:- start:349 stop:528 length:180 start_codon:yes stop_codon:yes gene_type:complete